MFKYNLINLCDSTIKNGDKKMREDINESMERIISNYDLIEIAKHFNFITEEEYNNFWKLEEEVTEDKHQYSFKLLPQKAKKAYIKKRAYSDEVIAEYIICSY